MFCLPWPRRVVPLAFLVATFPAAVSLSACSSSDGDGDDGRGTRGLVLGPSTAVATLTPAQFQAAAPAALVAVAGAPQCSVSFVAYQYGTVGGAAGEFATTSGAILVPSGSAAPCQGPRPVVLYAHGTTTDKNKSMANPQDGEATLVAATFAAQGYIVVAPNYAGYGNSTLAYHPYLNADQQSKDMIDGLQAARSLFARVGANASSKLFVTGYSQGGHVALATARALQVAGTPVTAAAPMSGPYNLLGFGDAVFAGNVNLGATVFTPLLTTSYQRSYGDLYRNLTEVYEDAYAPEIDTLLPSTTPLDTLFAANKLPQAFLFNTAPTSAGFESFFGTPNLIKASYRQGYLVDALTNPAAPTHPLRRALKANTLLDVAPTTPTLLCGGNADPTVFYSVNTVAARNAFNSSLVTALDIDSAPSGPYAALMAGFAQAKQATAAAAGGGAAGAAAVTLDYHGGLVPPFCSAAARAFFGTF
jgi:alpha-beta hydrolase superfamily lysophospholipase